MKRLILSIFTLFTVLNINAQNNVNSLEFDGVDDEVICNNPLTANMNAMSVMFYAKFSQMPSGDDAFITDWPAGGIGSTFKIDQYVFNGVTNRVRINLTTSNGSYELTHDLQVADYDTWNNWAFTYDDDSVKIYKNGNMVESLSTSGGTLSPTDAVIRIGEEGNNTALYTGLMDDIHIWDIELTAQNVIDYIDCHPIGNEVGLIGYWNFDEGTGTNAADLTTNGNDGTLTNGPTWSVDMPSFNCGLGISEITSANKELVRIVDLMGRETKFKPNTPLIYIYNDGSTERIIKIK